jgi:hypothetical protein
MCPIDVAGVIFKCFLMVSSVRPGHVERWPFFDSIDESRLGTAEHSLVQIVY